MRERDKPEVQRGKRCSCKPPRVWAIGASILGHRQMLFCEHATGAPGRPHASASTLRPGTVKQLECLESVRLEQRATTAAESGRAILNPAAQ